MNLDFDIVTDVGLVNSNCRSVIIVFTFERGALVNVDYYYVFYYLLERQMKI